MSEAITAATAPASFTAPEPLPDPDAIADAAGRRGQPAAFLPLFVFACFGASLALYAAVTAGIPLRLSALDPAHKTQLLSLTVGIGGVVVMLVTAPLGRLSDVSTSRFGIRRPFILGGAVAGGCGMLMLAFASNVPLVIAGWAVTQAGFAATSMALNALLADQVPTRIRARVAALFGLANGIAPFVGSSLIGALPDVPLLWFGVPAGIAFVSCIGVVFALRDNVRTEPVHVDRRSLLRSYWINPVRYRDFAWAWCCRLLVTMSLVSVVLYLLYFLTDRLGIAQSDAASKSGTVLGAYFLGCVLTTLVFGWISDRTGRRKAIVWTSTLLTAAGLLISLYSHDFGTFTAGIAVAGMGQGAYIAVDMAMMTEVLPPDVEAGAGLAVVALSYQLPQLLVPLLATPLLALGRTGPDYFALFLGSVLVALLGALAVLPVKSVR